MYSNCYSSCCSSPYAIQLSCGDKFCHECFISHVAKAVNSSYGISLGQIKCDCCKLPISKEEWSKHLDQETIDKYERLNCLYRAFNRYCPHCQTELMPPTCKPSVENWTRNIRTLCSIVNTMSYSCKEGSLHETHQDHLKMRRLIGFYRTLVPDWPESELPALHRNIVEAALDFQTNHIADANTAPQFAFNISLQFQTLCNNPKIWTRVHLENTKYFPNIACPNCGPHVVICLGCGYDSHNGLTCEDNMAKIANSNSTSIIIQEEQATIKWKLENSKRCPGCSVFSTKEEGDNEANCTYCSFSYCWECKESWEKGCGYERCRNIQPMTTGGNPQ